MYGIPKLLFVRNIRGDIKGTKRIKTALKNSLGSRMLVLGMKLNQGNSFIWLFLKKPISITMSIESLQSFVIVVDLIFFFLKKNYALSLFYLQIQKRRAIN